MTVQLAITIVSVGKWVALAGYAGAITACLLDRRR